MLFQVLFTLYTNPKEQWLSIHTLPSPILAACRHLLCIALVPTLTAYLSCTLIGWSIIPGKHFYLTSESALGLAICMYIALIFGVCLLAYLTHWMSHTFGSYPTYSDCFLLAAYIATPVFMSGLSGLVPNLAFIMLCGLMGTAYSIYLLYTGLPIIMNIPASQGFLYASSVITVALVLLISLLTATVLLWDLGISPELQFYQ